MNITRQDAERVHAAAAARVSEPFRTLAEVAGRMVGYFQGEPAAVQLNGCTFGSRELDGIAADILAGYIPVTPEGFGPPRWSSHYPGESVPREYAIVGPRPRPF